MPYPPEHKQKTRAKIVEAARALFNRRGFAQVTIDDIMAEAGLTRGGFYHHFPSKDALHVEAVQSFSRDNPFVRRVRALEERPDARQLARLLVELYLSDEVLEDISSHCPLIALPSDVARAGPAPRRAYTDIVESMLRVFRAGFRPGDGAAEHKAQVILNLCVGGMVIARTTNDRALRSSLRRAARAQALALLEGDGSAHETSRTGRTTSAAPRRDERPASRGTEAPAPRRPRQAREVKAAPARRTGARG